ncbi:B3 domain-containing protein [Forsythia ovata]|uniref:B3 domain-containing protein n=1 Tax=Forsythia ovata TaxID=205694 RepID=A0ABD1TT77_9LAMI
MEAKVIQQVHAQAVDPDHWRIKKVLKRSDVDDSSRLLIGRKLVLTHITPFFTNNPSEFCQNKEEIRVTIFYVNTLIEHMLTLKKWATNSFVLLNNWKNNFVNRRKLKENDEVGLRWDVNTSRLEFTVLERHQNYE